jgi:hypothetical protein
MLSSHFLAVGKMVADAHVHETDFVNITTPPIRVTQTLANTTSAGRPNGLGLVTPSTT